MRAAVAWSVFAGLAPLSAGLITVPVILGRVGVAGFGAWTLAMAVVLVVAIAATGLGGTVQRFVAVARGAGRQEDVGRLLTTTVVLHAAAGAVAVVAMQLLSEPLAGLADVEGSQRMFSALGLAIALLLVGGALGDVLQGLDRFSTLAWTAATGSLAWLAAVLVLVHDVADLPWALVVQECVVIALRGLALRRLWRAPGGVGELLAFAARLQPTVIAELANWQSDRLVVAAIAPATRLGQLGIGSQVADSLRVLAGAAMSPIAADLAATAGRGGDLKAAFLAAHRNWTLAVAGTTAILAISLPALIPAWLGEGYGEAVRFAIVLSLASGAGLLTATGVAFLRAAGRPGLEARAGLVVIVANLVLTVPLAFALGALGVVLGTLGAYAAGSAFFLLRLRSEAPVLPSGSGRAAIAGVLCGAAALGNGLGWFELLGAGWALPPAGLGVGVALIVYARSAQIRLHPMASTGVCETMA